MLNYIQTFHSTAMSIKLIMLELLIKARVATHTGTQEWAHRSGNMHKGDASTRWRPYWSCVVVS